MNTTTTPTVSLKVSRHIKAPRERVFAAWITPSDIVKWFGCDGSYVHSAKVDARVGGEYHFLIKKESSGEMEVRGVYREVKSPSRIVFTWVWTGKNCGGMEMGETVVTVDLFERNGGTEVQIIHEGFSGAEVRDQHSYGWNGCLDKMEKLS